MIIAAASKPWDDLTEAEKLASIAFLKRHHSSARSEVVSNRLDAITMAIDFLRARGFHEAASALEGEVFEVAPTIEGAAS